MAAFALLESLKLISRKIWTVIEKSWNFHTVNQSQRMWLTNKPHLLATNTATLERKTKTPDEYAKDLEQWLKKMKCTGVTGIRLESFNDIKVGVLEEKVDTSAPSVEPFPKLWQQKFKYKGTVWKFHYFSITLQISREINFGDFYEFLRSTFWGLKLTKFTKFRAPKIAKADST